MRGVQFPFLGDRETMKTLWLLTSGLLSTALSLGCSSSDSPAAPAPDASADSSVTNEDVDAGTRPPVTGEDAAADVQMPVYPATCVDLGGEYLMNSDHFTLTQSTCKSLEWVKETGFSDPKGWKHTYQTDGLTRDVQDEASQAVSERAHFEDDSLFIERAVKGSAAKTYRVFLTDKPCNLLNPSGKYLTRETLADGSKTPLKCEFWSKL
jgi:hypothetical protein